MGLVPLNLQKPRSTYKLINLQLGKTRASADMTYKPSLGRMERGSVTAAWLKLRSL